MTEARGDGADDRARASRRRARRPASGAGRCSPRRSSRPTSSATARWPRSRPRRPAGTPLRAWHDAMLAHGSPPPRHLPRPARRLRPAGPSRSLVGDVGSSAGPRGRDGTASDRALAGFRAEVAGDVSLQAGLSNRGVAPPCDGRPAVAGAVGRLPAARAWHCRGRGAAGHAEMWAPSGEAARSSPVGRAGLCLARIHPIGCAHTRSGVPARDICPSAPRRGRGSRGVARAPCVELRVARPQRRSLRGRCDALRTGGRHARRDAAASRVVLRRTPRSGAWRRPAAGTPDAASRTAMRRTSCGVGRRAARTRASAPTAARRARTTARRRCRQP